MNAYNASGSLTSSLDSFCSFQHLLEEFQPVKTEPLETKAEPEESISEKVEPKKIRKTSRKAKQILNRKKK